MFRRIAVVLLVLALGVGVAACGDDDENGADTTATETDGTTDETTTEAGRSIFVEQCGVCHTLSDAGTTGTTGPSLDGRGLSEDEVEQQVREGGGGMPAFEDTLEDDEIADVSAYVASQG